MRADYLERSSQRSSETTDLPRWIADGTVGGLVATVVMTAYRMPVSRSLPPTAEFWSRFVAGGDPEDHLVPAIALHLVYGAGGGSVFGALFGASPWSEASDRVREPACIVMGAVYGVVLSVFGLRVVLGRLLSKDLDATESLIFHVGHLVFGLSLGSWVGSRATLEEFELR